MKSSRPGDEARLRASPIPANVAGHPRPSPERPAWAPILAACGWATALIAALAGPAQTSCECDVNVESRGFAFYHHETCPFEGDALVIEQARAAIFGVHLWRALPDHPALAAAWRHGGIELWQTGDGPIVDGAASTTHHLAPGVLDSLAGLFSSIGRESTVVLHAVRLGAFRSQAGADRLRLQLDELWPKEYEEETEDRDTTRTVDWQFTSCVTTRRPRLYVLPPGPDSLHRVCWGLYVDRADAVRAAKWIERLEGVRGQVFAVEASPAVILNVLEQASWRPSNY